VQTRRVGFVCIFSILLMASLDPLTPKAALNF
jgi:hypothetical protein